MDHEIRKMLAVSSMHVSAEARLWLEGVSHLSAQGRWGGHMVAPFADGYIVYAGQGIHHDLGAVSEFAIAAGCSHIMLDNDAMPLDGFKTYEHEIGDETSLDGFPPEARAAIEAARAHPEAGTAFEPNEKCRSPAACRRDGFCEDAWNCASHDAGIADELAEPGELDTPHSVEEFLSAARDARLAEPQPATIPEDARTHVFVTVTGKVNLLMPGIVSLLTRAGNDPALIEIITNRLVEGARAKFELRKLNKRMAGKEVVDTADFTELCKAAAAVVNETADDDIMDSWGKLSTMIERLRTALDAVS